MVTTNRIAGIVASAAIMLAPAGFALAISQAAFSNLTTNPSITYGDTSLVLSGAVSENATEFPAQGESVTVTIDGTAYTTTINDGSGDFSLPIDPSALSVAGSPYTIEYSYTGPTLDSADDQSTTLTVAQATAQINVTGYSATFDGLPHTAAGSATGVNGEDLSADLDLSGTTQVNEGDYPSDPWTFTDPSGNYASDSGTVDDAIVAPAPGTVEVQNKIIGGPATPDQFGFEISANGHAGSEFFFTAGPNNNAQDFSTESLTNYTVTETTVPTNYTPDYSFGCTANEELLPKGGLICVITNNYTPVPTPTADSQTVNTTEDVAVPITLTGAGAAGGDTISYSVQTDPANGVLSGTAPDLTYTPNDNTAGVDSFTFVVNDETTSQTSAPATVTIDVAGFPAPTADDQSLSTSENGAIAVTLTASGEGTLDYAVQNQPQSGTLSGTAPNLTYTPNVNFTGTDSFTFTASNPDESNTATISISVNAPAPSGGGGGGGGGGNGPIAGSITSTASTTNTVSTVPASGQVLGAATYDFSKNFCTGATGEDVTQLQTILIAGGYLSVPAPTGYYGAATKAAVTAYQKESGISPTTGCVGPLTRAALNKGTLPTSQDEKTSMLQTLEAELQALMAQIAALSGTTTSASTTPTTSTSGTTTSATSTQW